jgi:hypothetical protein
VKFNERGVDMLLPVGIAIVLVALASLKLAGIGTGRILTWIFYSVFLVIGGFVTAGQVFAVRQLKSAFKRSHDATLQAIYVEKFVDAAMRAFPNWFRHLVVTRFLLTTVGSVLVIVLLALPPASDYSGPDIPTWPVDEESRSVQGGHRAYCRRRRMRLGGTTSMDSRIESCDRVRGSTSLCGAREATPSLQGEGQVLVHRDNG